MASESVHTVDLLRITLPHEEWELNTQRGKAMETCKRELGLAIFLSAPTESKTMRTLRAHIPSTPSTGFYSKRDTDANAKLTKWRSGGNSTQSLLPRPRDVLRRILAQKRALYVHLATHVEFARKWSNGDCRREWLLRSARLSETCQKHGEKNSPRHSDT